jgi:murein DD-endopeptidase MepM/ murein hydrolase activator NlpD
LKRNSRRFIPGTKGLIAKSENYRAPGASRLLLHATVVSVIALATALTLILPVTRTGRASSVDEIDAVQEPASQVGARSVAQQPQQLLDGSISPPGDSILLAVLSLESSKTDSEIEQSIQRIHTLGLPEVAPSATATPTPSPESQCVDSGGGYCVYTVVAGDTLSGIATRLGFKGNPSLSAAEMLAQSNKPDVVTSDHIEPGQKLRIPKATGIIHTALKSETVSEVAQMYGVDAQDISDSPFNDLGSGSSLAIGQNVLVPDAQQVPSSAPATLDIDTGGTSGDEEQEPAAEPTEAPTEAPADTATPEPTDAPASTATPVPATATPAPTKTPAPTATPKAKPSATPKPGSSFFIWPVEGPISSYFGPDHPLGIDIDLYSTPNAEIKAARGGTVTFAGGDPCCSYGLYVIIDHGNGLTTLYGHLSKIMVSVGEEVDQGEVIGLGGRTGYATGNHLHFEIRINGNVVDPLQYLP